LQLAAAAAAAASFINGASLRAALFDLAINDHKAEKAPKEESSSCAVAYL
jgi:hypothetical protein